MTPTRTSYAVRAAAYLARALLAAVLIVAYTALVVGGVLLLNRIDRYLPH